jgi:hypothetical protein
MGGGGMSGSYKYSRGRMYVTHSTEYTLQNNRILRITTLSTPPEHTRLSQPPIKALYTTLPYYKLLSPANKH